MAASCFGFGTRLRATEGVDARHGQYRSINDALQQLHDQAKALGDALLAADLEGIQIRVKRKCGKTKPR